MRAISIVLIMLLFLLFNATACTGTSAISTSSTSIPASHSTITTQSSTYPAKINGTVMITDNLMVANVAMTFPAQQNQTYWIVSISATNNSYQQPISANYAHWFIAVGENLYGTANVQSTLPPLQLTIPPGSNGKFIIGFSVPNNLAISDAQIVYQGEKPFSYGRLTGGEKVIGYNLSTNTVVTAVNEPIPFGTYTYTFGRLTDSITLKSDGTYILSGNTRSKEVGTYVIQGTKLIVTNDVTGGVGYYIYKYSSQFKCLSLSTDNGVTWLSYYK